MKEGDLALVSAVATGSDKDIEAIIDKISTGTAIVTGLNNNKTQNKHHQSYGNQDNCKSK